MVGEDQLFQLCEYVEMKQGRGPGLAELHAGTVNYDFSRPIHLEISQLAIPVSRRHGETLIVLRVTPGMGTGGGPVVLEIG